PDLSFLCVFGALCYPTNDSKDLGKLKAKADISLGLAPNLLTHGPINSGLVPNLAPAVPYVPPTRKELDILFQPMFDEYFESSSVAQQVPPAPAVRILVNLPCPSVSISVDQDAPSESDRSWLMNFMKKFIETVRFRNDHFGAIMGYGDYVIGESVISRVYYVEGLGRNLFSVGQFCDSDLEVSFRKHSCYVQDTDGVELIKGSRGSNLYTFSHRRLNHLDIGTINDLARTDLVRGLPRLKFEKDHLCSPCQPEKSKKHTHKHKAENTIMEVLHTLHMDLCRPMRVQSINGKKYILVIVDDYSRFTWVKFLRSNDESPDFVIKFLTQVGIFHQKSVSRTPLQNGVVERRNRTLLEAARTMLIFSKAPMFLWAEDVATACHTQNRSLIHTRHNKTPYELVHDKKPDLIFSESLVLFVTLQMTTRILEIATNCRCPAPQRKERCTLQCTLSLKEEKSSYLRAVLSTTSDTLFFPMFDEYFNPSPNVAQHVLVAATSTSQTYTPSSTRIDQDTPSTSTLQTIKEAQSYVIPTSVEEDDHGIEVARMDNDL
nr:hypothetical protein [Tanacetum cinerariifolium]